MSHSDGMRAFGGWPLRGERAVRFIYTDEAGTSAKEPVSIVASVIVNADVELRPIASEVARLVAEYVPDYLQEGFLIHATEIFSGGRVISREKWSRDARFAFLHELVSIPYRNDIPIAVGMDFKKVDHSGAERFMHQLKINRNEYSHLLAFSRCMERSDYFLRNYLGGSEVGTIIAEDVGSIKKLLVKTVEVFRQNPITMVAEHQQAGSWQKALKLPENPIELKIEHVIDVPHFVQKGGAPLLQIADVCAFSFRRFLSGGAFGKELVLSMLGKHQGGQFVEDPVWFSGGSSGLFNTKKYWTQAQKDQNYEMIVRNPWLLSGLPPKSSI
jgi:hypothetical protein